MKQEPARPVGDTSTNYRFIDGKMYVNYEVFLEQSARYSDLVDRYISLQIEQLKPKPKPVVKGKIIKVDFNR